MPFRNEDVDALREGRFLRECLRMEVRQNVHGGAVYRGPGRIDQDRDRQLQFTLYMPGAEPYFDSYLPPGTIVPAERYWTLTATDYHGGRWECPRVSASPGWSQPAGGSIVAERLPFLESREEELPTGEGSGFEGFVFQHFDLVANRPTIVRTTREHEWSEHGSRDTAVAESGTVRFLVHQDEHHLRVTARDETAPFHPQFGERVREALQFTLAYPLSWAVTIETNGWERRTYLRGRPAIPVNPRIKPPVPRNVVGTEVATWQLFANYFAYVCSKEEETHPLSGEWNEVLRSSIASLQTEALVCAIAVESTCRHLDRDRRPAEALAPNKIQHWATLVDSVLQEHGCDERIRRRVAGTFKRMRRRDHTDLLRELHQSGAVDPSLVQAWSDWRHIMAHGDRAAQREFLKLHSACDALLTLLYQLYFHAIGYRGMYTHFASQGWPVRQYPPRAEAGA